MALMINERAIQILQHVVERYIRDGQPVASRILAGEQETGLSSATIRTIMADLEQAGYLTSPHTSSGRVPTRQGYRLFVNNLLMVQDPVLQKIQEIRELLDPHNDTQKLLRQAAVILSDMTELASVVTLPRPEKLMLRHIEFLPLSNQRILVILVINDHDVQNRIIHTHRLYTRQELVIAGNYLTDHYAGKELSTIQHSFADDVRQSGLDLENVCSALAEIVEDICDVKRDQEYCVAGERHMHALAQAFSEKRVILDLLEQAISAEGIKIYIGEESGHKLLDECSVVMASYSVEGKIMGVLGVIGPTRMAYHKVISAVDVTAKLLSQAFGEY